MACVNIGLWIRREELKGPACTTVSLADVEHKAKSGRQYQIKSPRDKAPMEEGIYAGPFLYTAHFLQSWLPPKVTGRYRLRWNARCSVETASSLASPIA